MITGPTCVTPGTTYQYLISGQWDVNSTMQVCLKGAVIQGLNGTCTGNSTPASAVLVIWNAGVTQGSLNLSSTAGNATLAVSVTPPLQAGSITTASKVQAVGYNSIPAAIHCGADIGGSCKPAYLHQWQQSMDNVHWSDIPGANGQDLLSIPALKQTSFFRRKTVESASGSIAYSNAAAVSVGPPATGSVAGSNLQ